MSENAANSHPEPPATTSPAPVSESVTTQGDQGSGPNEIKDVAPAAAAVVDPPARPPHPRDHMPPWKWKMIIFGNLVFSVINGIYRTAPGRGEVARVFILTLIPSRLRRQQRGQRADSHLRGVWAYRTFAMAQLGVLSLQRRRRSLGQKAHRLLGLEAAGSGLGRGHRGRLGDNWCCAQHTGRHCWSGSDRRSLGHVVSSVRNFPPPKSARLAPLLI